MNYRLGKIFDEQMQRAGHRRGALDRGAVPRSDARAVDAGAADLYQRRGDWLKAAQMMVRAEAAHRQHAREDAPAVRGRQDLPGASSTTRTQAAELFARVARSSIPSTSRRPSRWREIYFKREQWAPLVPHPRHAGPQGRPQGRTAS